MKRLWSATVVTFGVLAGLVVGACGGGDATVAPPSPTPTRAIPTATLARPTPTPGIPTPVILQGKRGGTLQLRSIPGSPVAWDTMDVRGSNDFQVMSVLLNNLIWPDPYADGRTLVGDVAERWEFSEDGRTITFFLRKGIQFHDGTPLTSRDVAYNLERGWKPRSPAMTFFKAGLQALANVETPDDYTLRLTLVRPSNSLFNTLSTNQLLVYPAHLSFPEKSEEFKRSPIGTGPFKFKSLTPNVRMEVIRNDNYIKPGLPYLDGIVFTQTDNAIGLAAFRAGRLDATNFDGSVIGDSIEVLKREQGFVPLRPLLSLAVLALNQRQPWTNPRVREAVDLALNRQEVVAVWLRDDGNPYASPLLPPELGGQWGISREVMKNRPGYRPEKAQDLARAKELMAEAGLDSSKVLVALLGANTYPQYGEAVERSFAALGFKTKVDSAPGADRTERLLRGDYDIDVNSTQIQFDDPGQYLGSLVVTGGGLNYAKWSNPMLDKLMAEQDGTLDLTERSRLLKQVQEIILSDRVLLPVAHRTTWTGYMPWVKNFPEKLPFSFSPRFRWEQVWLER